MTKENAIKELKKLVDEGGDTEIDHVRADEILCELLTELGCSEVVEAFNEIDKWYA